MAGLGELLRVHENEKAREGQAFDGPPNQALQQHAAAADFADLEATWPPGATTRANSTKQSRTIRDHAASPRCAEILTASVSIPANQLRSQLSAAYCTISRNGGDVTISRAEALATKGVCAASPSPRIAGGCGRGGPSASSARDFFKINLPTSRGGGVCPRLALILTCDSTETA